MIPFCSIQKWCPCRCIAWGHASEMCWAPAVDSESALATDHPAELLRTAPQVDHCKAREEYPDTQVQPNSEHSPWRSAQIPRCVVIPQLRPKCISGRELWRVGQIISNDLYFIKGFLNLAIGDSVNDVMQNQDSSSLIKDKTKYPIPLWGCYLGLKNLWWKRMF